MGIAGTMAFAPLGSSPSVAGASEMVEATTEQGLITPKADDPVIYTTESGLEIKWGNALNITTLGSGNLAGFPYFTTGANSKIYTWVIIGTSSTSLAGRTIVPDEYLAFSTWITSSSLALGEFNNQYETATPAGIATNAELAPDYLATMNSLILPSLTNLTINEEIPANCVLCLANDIVAKGVANTSSFNIYKRTSSMWYHNANSTYAGNLVSVMDGYYSNGSWGLSAIKKNIQSVSLVTNGKVGSTSASASWSWSSNTAEKYIFPLAAANSGSFQWGTYLTSEQVKLSENQWCRDGANVGGYASDTSDSDDYKYYPHKYYIDTSGANATATTNTSSGYRPAFCLKVV